MPSDELKREAARAALELLPERGVIGLGSGSTAKLFIDAVGELVKAGRKLVGVPTSEYSRRQAEALGIPLLDDIGPWTIDVCVDGADEVSHELDLIKGGGGCHTREKVINYAARRNVIVVDDSKLCTHLGERWSVPVEVLQFAHLTTKARLEQFGEVRLRQRDGETWITDSGNLIYDVACGVITNPADMDSRLHATPGVVETGLFVGRTDTVVIAASSGITLKHRHEV